MRLDGNVHLIGTQGVGKSTVLRAILFFYTGDKTRLGISREKKSFDDFYLPGPIPTWRTRLKRSSGLFPFWFSGGTPGAFSALSARPSPGTGWWGRMDW